MKHRGFGDLDLLNLDSFADIMTNIVAILIIFVMVGIVTSYGVEQRPRVRVGTGLLRDGAHVGSTACFVVCHGGRITPLMPVDRLERLGDLLVAPGDVADFPHFRAVMLTPDQVAFEPRPGERGSTLAGLEDPDAEFRRLLEQLNPQRHHLVFLVDGDSFDLFRAARAMASQAGLSVAWLPQQPSPGGRGIPAGTIVFSPRGMIPEIQR